jgi:CheY-like chemotaxis protein
VVQKSPLSDLPTPRLVSAIRRATGHTQESLARELGVSFATLNAWERGRSNPRTSHRRVLEGMGKKLGVSMGLKVLVVDDNQPSARLLKAMLVASCGEVTVWIESNRTDALLRCGAVQPDVMFLDILMPGLDGFETAQRVANMQGLDNVRVVFVTASMDEATLARARSSSAAAVLQKPFNTEDLEQVLGEIGATLLLSA